MSLGDRLYRHRHHRRRGYRPERERQNYMRFYGIAETMGGRKIHYGFQVRISRRVSRQQQYSLVSYAMGKIKNDRVIPQHRRGQTFSSFAALFGTSWVRVRKILDYQVSS